MSISNIFSLLTGIALFLFGMNMMGDGLKKVAGSRLEMILYKLSSTPLKGILLGTGTTAIIQSSSATSVMVVGFVNSGMMKVKQAIGIIMGAIIGTSMTGWIICLSSVNGKGVFELLSTNTLTSVIAVVGIVFKMVSKKESRGRISDILLGFAVLMVGISAMSDAVYPLRESETFISMLTTFSNPIIGVLVGILFTSVIQSASAAVGILQALAVTGAISFRLALPVIMGIAIGASVPVLLSALGANVNGKRTAFIYLLVDTLGVIVFSILFFGIHAIVHFPFMDATMSMVSISALNTVFRVIIVLLLSPCIGALEKLVTMILPDRSGEGAHSEEFARLDRRFLAEPAIAIEQTRITINIMASLALKGYEAARELFSNYSEKGMAEVAEIEDLLDEYEDHIGRYATQIMANELNAEENKALGEYLHAINDFERISDHVKNLSEAALEIHTKGIEFSPQEAGERDSLIAAVGEILKLSVQAFTENDMEISYRIEPLEQVIDYFCDEYKNNQVERIRKNICPYQDGYVYNDMLTDFERIGDHCSNIGIALRVRNDELSGQHGVVSKREMEQNNNFSEYYQEYLERFSQAG